MDKKQLAIRWLLDVITDAPAAEKHRVFRIQNLELLETLGLERRKGFRYSIEEILPKIDTFSAQVRRARATKPDERDLYQQKVLELDQRFNQYILLREAFRPTPLHVESLSDDLAQDTQRRQQNEGTVMPLAVPPQQADGKWQPYAYAVFDALALRMAAGQGLKAAEPNPATVALVALLGSYSDKSSDSAAFNRNLQAYRDVLNQMNPSEWNSAKTNFEASFNHFSPLYYAMMLYLLAFVLGLFAWLGWSGPLTRACTWLVLFTFVIHTAGLIGRIYISGRPPVTNLYSSALFVGWAAVLMAVLFEYYSRRGIGNVVGALDRFRRVVDRPFADHGRALVQRRFLHGLAGRARHPVLAGHARDVHHGWAIRRRSSPGNWDSGSLSCAARSRDRWTRRRPRKRVA